MTIRDIQNQGSRASGTMRSTIRSATLIGYPELARSLGLDSHRLMGKCGLDPSCLSDPDTRIDAAAVAKLPETSAAESGVEDFGEVSVKLDLWQAMRHNFADRALDVPPNRSESTTGQKRGAAA